MKPKLRKKAKYRPVLTAPQILHLLALAKLEQPLTDIGISCISTLSTFKAKIENAGIMPAYTSEEPRYKINSLEALGEGVPTKDDFSLSKEEIWAKDYAAYKLTPTECSLQEIKNAREHMYLNDLMSVEEVVAFEREAVIELNKREAI